MKNTKIKFIVTTIVVLLVIIAIQTSTLASNENIEILQKSSSDYLLYIKDNLNTDFEFAFSNTKEQDKTDASFLNSFISAGEDSSGENANKIAYVNNNTKGMFANPTYMWAKDSNGNYIVDGIEIDLTKALHISDLENVANVTKTVEVDLTKTNTEEKVIDGKKITTTVGKVVLPENTYINRYILLKANESNEKLEAFNLATRISKFNNETDMYTKIKIYSRFNTVLENISNNIIQTEWKKINENEIQQPEEAQDGEEYILLLGEDDGRSIRIMDFQFLTSTKKESQEKIIEKITTKLPITYDNNTLIIVLIVLIIATIIVSVRIKNLNKKQKE